VELALLGALPVVSTHEDGLPICSSTTPLPPSLEGCSVRKQTTNNKRRESHS